MKRNKYKPDNRNDQEEEKYVARLTKQQEGQSPGRGGINMIEPNGLEFISALAAGNQAKVLVQIMANHSNDITSLTIALAVAATQTGGKLICVIPFHHHHHLTTSNIRHQLSLCGLLTTGAHNYVDCDHHQDAVVELRVGHPNEQIRDLKNIDFAVIDGQFDHCDHLCQNLHLNPKGAIIVANNWLYRVQMSIAQLVDQLLKGRRGVQSSVTILPLESPGHVQVILKIKSIYAANMKLPPRRRHKRFLVTFNA